MIRLLLILALLPVPALAQAVERSPQEVANLIILLGRACRASSDQDWIAVCCVSLIVATLVWLGTYCSGMKVDVRSLQLRMREVEASQRHLKSIVERGWAQSLDLTKIDWRRPDPAQE